MPAPPPFSTLFRAQKNVASGFWTHLRVEHQL